MVDRQVSGIPHALAGFVAALAANKTVQSKYEIVLVAPKNRLHLLNRWRGLESCSRKAIPMKFRVMNGLGRRGLLPPMDLLLGKGVYLFGNYFNWPLTKRSKSFTFIHDACFAIYPQYVQPDNQRMLSKNVPRYLKQTNYVITVSESSKQEISKLFKIDPNKIIVVYNGVEKEVYKPYSPAQYQPVLKKYGLEAKKYLIFVGNIEPRKNLERLVKAMRQVPKDYSLIMIGSDGWLNEKVFKAMDEVRAEGRTIIKPGHFVPDKDVVRLISGSKALVQPSLHEGFGMPPLEAMVGKTLAVVSDIPVLREVVGSAGIYFDPYNIDDIAKAINKAINLPDDQRQKLIAKGLEQAKKFSWDDSAKKMADLLETIKI